MHTDRPPETRSHFVPPFVNTDAGLPRRQRLFRLPKAPSAPSSDYKRGECTLDPRWNKRRGCWIPGTV